MSLPHFLQSKSLFVSGPIGRNSPTDRTQFCLSVLGQFVGFRAETRLARRSGKELQGLGNPSDGHGSGVRRTRAVTALGSPALKTITNVRGLRASHRVS